MKRLIRWLFRWRKPYDFSKLEHKFTDSNGMRYYKYRDDFDTPLKRMAELQNFSLQLSRQLSDKELESFLEAIESNVEKCVSGDIKPAKALGKITALVDEIKLRKENVIHSELMFDIVAALYIREDENPNEYDNEIHKQKVAQFNKDSKDKLYDFFYNAGLTVYLPFLPQLKDDLEQLLDFSDRKREGMSKAVSQLA